MSWYKKAQITESVVQVDFNQRARSLPSFIRSKINNRLHQLGSYHNQIPLQTIFDILEEYHVIPLQEDGTKWSGFLLGEAPCGTPESHNQNAHFPLGIQVPDGSYQIATSFLHLSWCIISEHPRKRYEIVCYVG
jgi:hypothetical protein